MQHCIITVIRLVLWIYTLGFHPPGFFSKSDLSEGEGKSNLVTWRVWFFCQNVQSLWEVLHWNKLPREWLANVEVALGAQILSVSWRILHSEDECTENLAKIISQLICLILVTYRDRINSLWNHLGWKRPSRLLSLTINLPLPRPPFW